MKPSLSASRRQQRLADLHRAVSNAVQDLHRHQVVLVTVLRSDDAASQQSMLEEHRARVTAAAQALAALDAFIDRCRDPTIPESADGAPATAILRVG